MQVIQFKSIQKTGNGFFACFEGSQTEIFDQLDLAKAINQIKGDLEQSETTIRENLQIQLDQYNRALNELRLAKTADLEDLETV